MHGSRYDLWNEIGWNHYGTVHDAFDRRAKQEVAIMELHQRFREDEQRWGEIWRQTLDLAAARLDNVVPVHDTLEDRAWVVMEKMHGTLAELAGKRALAADEVRSVLRQALTGLKAYHDWGAIHGDVKPANLLFSPEGLVKLSFSPGILIDGEVPKRQKDFKYLAPEMLNAKYGELGPAADLYSLGFTAIELLTGPKFHANFKAVSAGADDPDAAWMRWHLSADEELPSLAELVPSAPPDLVNVINQLVRKPVDGRYDCAQAALNDLANQPLVVIAASRSNKLLVSPPDSSSGDKAAHASTNVAAGSPAQTESDSDSGHGMSWAIKGLAAVAVAVAVLMSFRLLRSGDDTVAVRVRSKPAGASVSIDNQTIDGKTPVGLELSPGEHRVTMRLDGYEILSRTLRVSPEAVDQEFMGVLAKVAPQSPGDSMPPEGAQPSGAPLSPWELPSGLQAAPETEQHPTLRLPVLAVAKKTAASGQPLRFVLIEPGEYSVGTQEPVRGELARRQVTLSEPFYLSTTEVSNDRYRLFAEENPDAAGTAWEAVADGGMDPVRNVSHVQAQAFCVWLSVAGRLPTEAEWEIAARGTSDRLYPWGDEPAPSAENCNLAFDGRRELQPVDGYDEGATPSGIHHLLGNVAEWCQETYVAGAGDERSPGVGVNPVIRGGSFKQNPALQSIRLTTRANTAASGADDVGFRVLFSVTGQ